MIGLSMTRDELLAMQSGNAAQGAAIARALAATPAPIALPGVNLAGGEFGSRPALRGAGMDYIYPTNAQVDYWAAKGFKLIRLPFLMERYRKDAAYIASFVAYAATKGMTVVLDLHEYGRTETMKLIGRDTGSVDEFAAQWGLLAKAFASAPNVMFGLMNEPNIQTAAEWLLGANAAAAAIRAAGAKQMILVPGSYWTGAQSWVGNGSDQTNGKVMAGFKDPGNNYAFEVHQYLDQDNSGTHYADADVVKGKGATTLADVTGWARARGAKLFLGEFGASATPAYMAELDALCAYMAANSDVWMGYAYWAAGAWWSDYPFAIEPKAGQDAPQVAVLKRYM